jgi:WD40 repeat protein
MITRTRTSKAAAKTARLPRRPARWRQPGHPFRRACRAGLVWSRLAAAAFAQERVTFQDHVLPLVEQHCSKCHSADKKKADVEMTSYAAVLKGGGSGPIVASGNPDGSKLWKVLTHAEEPFMPPNRPKLSDKELEVIKKWIAGGLLEASGSKAVVAAKPAVDLTLKLDATGKPAGPPPMPKELPLEPVVHTPRAGAILGLAGSPWAPLVAAAGQRQVLLFHTDTLELLGILPFAEGQPEDVRFSRSGKLLLAAGGRAASKGRAILWNVASGERLATLGDEFDTLLAADVRPDQSQVAIGGPSRLVKIFSTATGAALHTIKKHTEWVTAVAYSPNGEFLATGDRNGGLLVWDPDNAQELLSLTGHKGAVSALSWRGDSKVLASASEDGTVKWWETQEGKPLKSWTAHNGGALSVSFTHDGRLVTCGRDQAVTVWKADGTKARSFAFFGELPLRACFSHDGRRVFATDFAGRLAAWNTEDGNRLGELNANPPPLAEQITAAERRLAELQPRATAAAEAVAAADRSQAQAAAALEAATKALDSARHQQAARENEVVRLKQLTNAPPPDLDALLAAARADRQKAREATTNALQLVQTRTRELEVARAEVAKARAGSPDAAMADARAVLTRLQAARVFSTLHREREELAARKREHERAVAQLAASQKALGVAEKELAGAREAAARAERAMQSAKAEMAETAPVANRLASEIETRQARLKELTEQYERAKSGGAATAQAKK